LVSLAALLIFVSVVRSRITRIVLLISIVAYILTRM